MPAFRTAAAHALIAVNNVFNKIVNSPVAPGYFFFCSSTKLVTVIHSVSINQTLKKKLRHIDIYVTAKTRFFFF